MEIVTKFEIEKPAFRQLEDYGSISGFMKNTIDPHSDKNFENLEESEYMDALEKKGSYLIHQFECLFPIFEFKYKVVRTKDSRGNDTIELVISCYPWERSYTLKKQA